MGEKFYPVIRRITYFKKHVAQQKIVGFCKAILVRNTLKRQLGLCKV